MTTAVCASCHGVIDLDELLAVIPHGRPWAAFYVCRTSTERMCFSRVVRSAAEERIESAEQFHERTAAA